MRVVESEWEGKPACLASLRDVTDRRRAEHDARELIREHAARAVAEDAARRLRFLLESTTRLAASLDYQTTLSALAQLCVAEIADWAIVYGVDESGVPQPIDVAHRDPARAALVGELRRAALAPEGPHPVHAVLATRRPMLATPVRNELLESLTTAGPHAEVIRQLGAASLLIVPIVARDQALGAIVLVSADSDRPFGEQAVALAEDLAARAALAVANARLYEEAQKANKTKTDFLAVLSHDLRTPLTAIIGYIDLMELGVPDPLPEATRQRLKRIHTSATHLLYLLNELLIFARLDAGRDELRPRVADLREVVREAAAVAEPLATGRQLQFCLDLPDHPVTLRTDPDKVRQILLNLVGNAVKYTSKGEVRVELRSAEEHRAVIQVRDTGIGIAPHDLPHIFEPFWQVDSTRRRSPDGGTGLGLSVVRRLVQLLGGEVSVESAVGRGTVFTVTLPSN
jgi:signal transduction histidine kinase